MFTPSSMILLQVLKNMDTILLLLRLTWIFRSWCPCCPVVRKPIGNYLEYKKSHQYKAGWRPAKRLWAWHWLNFLWMVVKPIKGGFRIRNVGFHCAGITVSWRKNIRNYSIPSKQDDFYYIYISHQMIHNKIVLINRNQSPNTANFSRQFCPV